MDYKASLNSLRERLFNSEEQQRTKPSSSSFIMPQASSDNRDSSDIIAISKDWLQTVKASSANAKIKAEKAMNESKGGFGSGFVSSLNKAKEKKEEVSKSTKGSNDIPLIRNPLAEGGQTPVGSGGGEIGPASDKPNSGYGDISPAVIEKIIEDTAIAKGIEPTVAKKIYRSEGHGSYQSLVKREGKGSYNGLEDSYGPFQLYRGGGLGNEYEKVTGRNLRTDNTLEGITRQIDFALDNAKKSGWGAWYGRKTAGVGIWDGIKKG